ncbi:MAG: thiamine diphosphokinase [Ardenticatenales bacterium]|nr:thiamine diphosphokinase [Ardenticatenales bacterium]
MKHDAPKRVVLLANGELHEADYVRALLRPDDLLIAANGGTRHAWTLQVLPALLVGDRDSLPESLHRWLDDNKVPQYTHPREKDETDLELALHHALELGASSLLFVGATGGRMDHTLANLSLLAHVCAAGVQAEVVVGKEHLHLVYQLFQLHDAVGHTVSLLPWGGDAKGVTTQGFVWELHGETLGFGPARGISNVVREPLATVSVEEGMLLLCHQRGEVR